MTCRREKRENRNGDGEIRRCAARSGRTFARLRKADRLQDVSRKETVAILDAKADAEGHLESVPVKLFVQDGGYNLRPAMY